MHAVTSFSWKRLLPRKCLFTLAWAAGLLAAGGPVRAQTPAAQLPPGDGKQLLATACTQCHSLKPILMLRDGAAGWKRTVDDMILRGAQLMPEESETVIQYLAKNYGPGSKPVQSQKAASASEEQAVSLPAGRGKELVETQCTMCHGLDKITGEKRTKQEWANTVKNMVERGLSATPEQIQTITSYLSTQFGR